MKSYIFFLILLVLSAFPNLGLTQPQAVPSYQKQTVASSSLSCASATTTPPIPFRRSATPCKPIISDSIDYLFKDSHLTITRLSSTEMRQTQGGLFIEGSLLAVILLYFKSKAGDLMGGVMGGAGHHADDLAHHLGETKKSGWFDRTFRPEKTAKAELESAHSALLKDHHALPKQQAAVNQLVGHVNEMKGSREKIEELNTKIRNHSPAISKTSPHKDSQLLTFETARREEITKLKNIHKVVGRIPISIVDHEGAQLVEIQQQKVISRLIHGALKLDDRRVVGLQPVEKFEGLINHAKLQKIVKTRGGEIKQGDLYAHQFRKYIHTQHEETTNFIKNLEKHPVTPMTPRIEPTSPRLSARTLSDGDSTTRSDVSSVLTSPRPVLKRPTVSRSASVSPSLTPPRVSPLTEENLRKFEALQKREGMIPSLQPVSRPKLARRGSDTNIHRRNDEWP